MVDSLISYYKNHVMTHRLVFQYMRFQYNFYYISFIAFLMSCFFCLVPIFLVHNKKLWVIAGFLLIITGSILLGSYKLFKSSIIIILRSKYSIESDGKLWKSSKFKKFQRKKLIKYLDSCSLYSEGKLILLLDLLEKEKKRRTFPPLVAPGLILAFMVPNWVEFLRYLYINMEKVESAYYLFYSISILILVVGAMIQFLKNALPDIFGLIIRNEKETITNLSNLIQDIHIRYPEEVD